MSQTPPMNDPRWETVAEGELVECAPGVYVTPGLPVHEVQTILHALQDVDHPLWAEGLGGGTP